MANTLYIAFKKCIKCGINKHLDDYYVHKKMADGHLSKCKSCIKDYVNLSPFRIERKKEINRKYSRSPRGRATSNKAVKSYQKRYPIKTIARRATIEAIRVGILERKPCVVCGNNSQIHAHHEDYNKPLDVVWLCHSHHLARHKELKEQPQQ